MLDKIHFILEGVGTIIGILFCTYYDDTITFMNTVTIILCVLFCMRIVLFRINKIEEKIR